MENTDEKIRIEELAMKIKLLFGFCTALIPDIDLLEKANAEAAEKSSMALSAAPVLEAVGLNYREKHATWDLRDKRSKALLNLLKVLKETEEERTEFNKEQEKMKSLRNLLNY